MHKTSKANEKYSAIAMKLKSQEWSQPLGRTMSFTGNILIFAGNCGVPIVGALGSALEFGANLLNPDTSLQDRFSEVFQNFGTVQNHIDNLEKTVKTNLLITADIKWEEGLNRVNAYCKNIYAKKTPHSIISYIDQPGALFLIQTDATQHFDEEKLMAYMNFLTEEKGIQECIEFYNYAMALRSQFLSILVLYYSFKNDPDEVNHRVLLWPIFGNFV